MYTSLRNSANEQEALVMLNTTFHDLRYVIGPRVRWEAKYTPLNSPPKLDFSTLDIDDFQINKHLIISESLQPPNCSIPDDI